MTGSPTHRLSDVNALDAAGFVAAFGDIAEHSPWVAERAGVRRPFQSRDTMIAAFIAAVLEAEHAEQERLIGAHPDLAGKAARAGALTEDSRREQAGAGLDSLTEAEFARFTWLNDSYRAKFGFPFIFAVRGATKDMILAGFEARVGNTTEVEFATALEQVTRIIRFRLEDRIAP
jgi:2-oxo-4-hydroxy-4-carboxy-5-ureidoimidazoline decarboxylase